MYNNYLPILKIQYTYILQYLWFTITLKLNIFGKKQLDVMYNIKQIALIIRPTSYRIASLMANIKTDSW